MRSFVRSLFLYILILIIVSYVGAGKVTPTEALSDSLAPATAISSPSKNSIVSGNVSVQAVANDNVDVAKLEIYADDSLLSTTNYATGSASVSATYYWDTRTSVDGFHTLSSKAFDSAGNIGTSSTEAMTVDNTPPQVVLTNPQTGSTVRRNSSISITANASDSSGIFSIAFLIDNQMVKTCYQTLSCQTTWLAFPRGVHTIGAIAVDRSPGANKSSTISTLTVK